MQDSIKNLFSWSKNNIRRVLNTKIVFKKPTKLVKYKRKFRWTEEEVTCIEELIQDAITEREEQIMEELSASLDDKLHEIDEITSEIESEYLSDDEENLDDTEEIQEKPSLVKGFTESLSKLSSLFEVAEDID